ncbi:dTDP-4-dehydrorhamnose 3,5-epimerase family protein [Deinococcus deserti]|uniref:Putative dTDP-4-dehydrorhamnose 3,5-epimerase n=1 Tax=Deinococcus deserti (strain DSM 17065 / CIP 109153 / LMG 22923 / VCD115) TaxID=546414 RepID=C1CYL5_DEIDV|nr:dTDP-4-dehydrorhamnose 3,5-epimerase family protein [Deinococcus deserti]ACO47045.1 putative dTDP-4-dehydrorhamnose 3,5-epimerase [Deinococcus deserti VCD115]
MKVELAPEYAAVLTFESYPPAPQIEGVWIQPLRKNRSENGAFMEYLRINEQGIQGLPGPLSPRQISVSWAAPGRVNAFHIHVKTVQNEIWCVIQGQLMVWLVDCRAGSSTLGVRRKLVLSGEQPTMVHIPSGVAHGYQASEEGATLLYSMDAQFDLDDPNEGRIAWNVFGDELWETDRG